MSQLARPGPYRNFIQQLVFFLTESNYSFPLEGKVQGGEEVSVTEMSFMAVLSHNGKFISHAFLISCKHALMGANLLMNFFTTWPLPVFKEYFLIVHGGTRPPPENVYDIEQVECHPAYRFAKPSISFNIAVLTVIHLYSFRLL